MAKICGTQTAYKRTKVIVKKGPKKELLQSQHNLHNIKASFTHAHARFGIQYVGWHMCNRRLKWHPPRGTFCSKMLEALAPSLSTPFDFVSMLPASPQGA